MSEPVPPLQLLLVEDSESDAALVLREFHRAGFTVASRRVQQAEDLRAALLAQPWDAIICDFAIPGFGAAAALEEVQRCKLDVPFLLVSGTIPDEAAVELMRHGAHDYILKGNLARLVPALRRELKDAAERRQRHRAELALEESRALYSSLVENLPAAVFRKDLAGRYVFVNAQFCAFRGCAPEDVLGREDPEPRNPDLIARLRAEDAKVVETGEVRRSEESFEMPGKGVRHIEMFKAPVRDPAGRVVGVQGFFWDVTQRRQAEEAHRTVEAQLRQMQKMEAIGQLSGGVAHDFNNILTVIQCHASLMEAEPGLAPEMLESATEISHAAGRATNLTRQLLAFSRRQTLRPANLDLNEVVANLTKMLQRIVGEDVSVHVHLSPEPACVHADAGMLEQVLLNLVVNARDAMPHGGRLGIETEICEIDAAAAAPWPEARPGEFVRLSVADTGCGIPPEIRARVFEPFFTTKDVGKGTGLGLATVYGIVRQHGGWITLESEVERGSVFRIHLPFLANATVAPGPGRAAVEPVRGGSETVLVVEDEAALRSLARTILTRLGYTVLEAPTGAAALDTWRRQRDQIALLVTDMVMPDHLSGRDLAKRLHAEKPALPVIFISGYSPELAGRELVLEDGVNFVPKPFTPRKLAATVRAALDRAHRAADPKP